MSFRRLSNEGMRPSEAVVETMAALQQARINQASPQMIQALEADLRELRDEEENTRARFERRRLARQEQGIWGSFPADTISPRNHQEESQPSGRQECYSPTCTRDHLRDSTSCHRSLDECEVRQLQARGEMISSGRPRASQFLEVQDHLRDSTACLRRLDEFEVRQLQARGETISSGRPRASSQFLEVHRGNDVHSNADFDASGDTRRTRERLPSYHAATRLPPPPYAPRGNGSSGRGPDSSAA
ncbi:MAG: hypothetical protein M1812_002062 [Candelaria pacifica]|nr:MAG: hypothetical protein M1812_002062 [Candelaria pacifica]